jgi:MFS family permease
VRARARTTFRSLGHRNFRLFFGGQILSATGLWIQRVAELWLVLELTDSSVAVGVVTALNFGPVLLLSPWGGLVADRRDKRRLLLVTQSARAVPAVLLGVLTLTGAVNVWLVYLLATATGLATAVDNPTRRVFIRELVGRDLVSNAVSLNSTMMTTARIVGPAIAGVLIASVDIGWCFLANGVSYGCVLVSLARIDPAALHRLPVSPRQPGQLRDAVRYTLRTPEVRTPLIMLAGVSTLAWGNLEVIVPLLARDTFDGDAGTYATLFAVMSVGSLGGSLFTAGRHGVDLRYTAVAASVLGALLLATAGAPGIVVTAVLLAVVGVAGASFVAADNSLVMIAAAPEYEGRVVSLLSALQLGSKSFGGLVVGAAASVAGARGALVVAGLAAIAVGVPPLLQATRLTPSVLDD